MYARQCKRTSPGMQPKPTNKDKGFFERVREMFAG